MNVGKVRLKLEKEGQHQDLEFTTGVSSLVHAGKQLRKFMKEGWQLVDCSGDDPAIIGYIQGEIQSYAQDPAKYQTNIKAMVKTATAVTGGTVKIRARDILRWRLKGKTWTCPVPGCGLEMPRKLKATHEFEHKRGDYAKKTQVET